MRALRILISGGGTGGHIFPALSIANAVKRLHPDAEILFVGAQGRMEMERVPAAGYRIVGLPVAGFDRRRPWRNLSVLVKLLRSLRKAKDVVREFRPDVAVGVGGYASGPVLKQAQRMGIPTLLQEQNSYAGVTNKLLGRKARAVCTAYEDMARFFPADKITLTGNPVREGIASSDLSPEEARERLGFDPSRPLVAAVGGSLGARTINEAMKACVASLLELGVSVLWQTGRYYAEECAAFAAPLAEKYGPERLQVVPFVANMQWVYAGATLMVSRAGASTISEIQLAGMPSVLVPSPNVAEDHQRKNAEALMRRGAALMLLDADAPSQLGRAVEGLLRDPDALRVLSQSARAMALPDADTKIARMVIDLAEQSARQNP